MSQMHNPPHSGEILKHDVLPELGLSVTAAAEQLGMSRVAFSRVLNGRAAISAEMTGSQIEYHHWGTPMPGEVSSKR